MRDASVTLEGSGRLSAPLYSDDQSPANPFWLNAVQTCNMLAILVLCGTALFNPNDVQMYLGFLLFLTPILSAFCLGLLETLRLA
jgi:hypothetical protein